MKFFLSITCIVFFSICATAQQTLLFEDFESGTFNSFFTPNANLTGTNGVVDIQTNTGVNNTRGVRLGKSVSDGNFTTNALDLKLDLSNQTKAELHFWIYDLRDETHDEDGLYLSDNDGASFIKVLNFLPDEWCDFTYGQYPPIDLKKLAEMNNLDFTNRFVIRFQQYGQDQFGGSRDGFYLDEIHVYNPELEYAALPFEEDFEVGILDNNWSWEFADNSSNVNSTTAYTSPMGFVGVVDNLGLNSSKAVGLGRRCGGVFSNNALDLHLDLSNETDVELSFWIYDNREETQDDDGLYFSDDGGDSFVKVLDFLFDEWCDFTYGRYPPIDVDRLALEAGLSFTDKFVIRFQQRGEDPFNGNRDGYYIDDVKVYQTDIAYSNLPFEDDFEIGILDNNWLWSFADNSSDVSSTTAYTSPMGFVGVVDNAGLNGSKAVGLGRRCGGVFSNNALDLHLDLSNETNVELSFWIYDNREETQDDDGLYFSDDGGDSFVKVLDFLLDEWCDFTYGRYPPIDVDQLALEAGLSLTDKFVIRFQQRGEDPFNGNRDGYYIDDVKVYQTDIVYSTLPFEDDFEIGILDNNWLWAFADNSSDVSSTTAYTSPMGFVGVVDNAGLNGSKAVGLGRRCGGVFSNNALDLHLDLSNETDVELSFWIYDNREETQDDDGLYFSDDGGNNFVKVLDFLLDEWCDFTYGQYPPIDVDQLAIEAGLSFTDKFVIRFQQRGEDPFGGNRDGYYIDDVKVYQADIVYSTLPFEDDFEVGILDNNWLWAFADNSSDVSSTTAYTSPMGFVGVVDNAGLNGSKAVGLGRRCGGVFSNNALDLHLDLSNETDVELSFWIYDNAGETDTDEGVFFSNDGGNSFIKAYDFDFSNMPDYTFEEVKINVSDLAASSGLSLSDEFIIRFQQRGENSFGGNRDGYYIDDVQVRNPTISSVEELSSSSIILHPNPSHDKVSIVTNSLLTVEKVVFFNSIGSVVMSSAFEELLDINMLEKGIYFVKITLTDASVHTRKLVVE